MGRGSRRAHATVSLKNFGLMEILVATDAEYLSVNATSSTTKAPYVAQLSPGSLGRFRKGFGMHGPIRGLLQALDTERPIDRGHALEMVSRQPSAYQPGSLRRMGSQEHFEGVVPRSASILIDFRWNNQRYRERVALRPTAANMRAAARMRVEILQAIALGAFTWDDFARYFPDSPRIPVKEEEPSQGPTFNEMANMWLKLISHKAATTLSEYENILNSRWRPLYGNRPIADITYEELALDVAEFPRMAAKTFNNIMTPARQVWALAFKMRKVPENITLEIESRKGQDPEPDPLLMAEVLLVIQHIETNFGAAWRNYFEVAFFTGLRPSELIALQWSRVDLAREQIRVDRALVRRHSKGTKTYKSRDVDLQKPALEALKRQRDLTFQAGGCVFLNPRTGKPFVDTADAVRKVWRPTLSALGIRDRDARQTRHTYATLGLHAGMNPGYLSRQMGHKNAQMFFRVYSKWIDGESNQREKAKMTALYAEHLERR